MELIPKHGGYRNLKSFQLAQLCFDVTVRFCDRFIDRRDRTHDQMVQAARSGKQNIAEGSDASGTSKKTELKLTGVAWASLGELALDYQDFLRSRRLKEWEVKDPRRQELVARRCADADSFATWVREVHARSRANGARETYAAIAANSALVIIGVTRSLLDRQKKAQARAFQDEGGFTERLYKVRSETRAAQNILARRPSSP
jgi:four helix bundle suffix protein